MSKQSKKEKIIVVVRCRPENEKELLTDARSIIRIYNDDTLVFDPIDPGVSKFGALSRGQRNNNCTYVFDHVFDQMATQTQVYENSAQKLISHVLDGYNGSVFAYGATGAGKTHTMIGNHTSGPGVMILALRDLYQRVENMKEEHTFKISISYMEVYNEQIRDLLSTENPTDVISPQEDSDTDKRQSNKHSSNNGTASLELCEESGNVTVRGLTWYTPHTADELLQLLEKGNSFRAKSPTDANALSSRSHAVLQIVLESQSKTSADRSWKTGKLSLIDLAGSERACVSRNRGDRQIEGANINKSLLALSNCINALSEGKKSHIPYRDSKLTRLLKDSLGGNCKTVMIANISPSSLSYEDTHNTLKYSDRAKNIKLSTSQNVGAASATQEHQEILALRQQIVMLQHKLAARAQPVDHSQMLSSFLTFKQTIKETFDKLTTLHAQRLALLKSEQQLVLKLHKTQRAIIEQQPQGDTADLTLLASDTEEQIGTAQQQQHVALGKMEKAKQSVTRVLSMIDNSAILDDNHQMFLRQQVQCRRLQLEKLDLIAQNQAKEHDLQLQIEKVKKLELLLLQLQSTGTSSTRASGPSGLPSTNATKSAPPPLPSATKKPSLKAPERTLLKPTPASSESTNATSSSSASNSSHQGLSDFQYPKLLPKLKLNVVSMRAMSNKGNPSATKKPTTTPATFSSPPLFVSKMNRLRMPPRSSVAVMTTYPSASSSASISKPAKERVARRTETLIKNKFTITANKIASPPRRVRVPKRSDAKLNHKLVKKPIIMPSGTSLSFSSSLASSEPHVSAATVTTTNTNITSHAAVAAPETVLSQIHSLKQSLSEYEKRKVQARNTNTVPTAPSSALVGKTSFTSGNAVVGGIHVRPDLPTNPRAAKPSLTKLQLQLPKVSLFASTSGTGGPVTPNLTLLASKENRQPHAD